MSAHYLAGNVGAVTQLLVQGTTVVAGCTRGTLCAWDVRTGRYMRVCVVLCHVLSRGYVIHSLIQSVQGHTAGLTSLTQTHGLLLRLVVVVMHANLPFDQSSCCIACFDAVLEQLG